MSRHTLTSYRALKNPITDEGPWDLTGNPNKPFYAGRQGQKILLIGMHITAGIDDFTAPDTSAESTNSWGKTATGASWHVCIDSDSIHPSLPDSYVAWVQGVKGYSFNKPGLGIEIGKRTTDWRKAPKDWVEKTLRNVAAWCAPRVIRYGIPLRVLTDRNEIQRLISAGKPVGFAEHWTLTPETRLDAGRVGSITTFPWARFFEILRDEINRRNGLPATLRQGDRGEQVKHIQERLIVHGYDLKPWGADGSFGEVTDTAVRAFQSDKGLLVDGVVGPQTLVALEAKPTKPEPPKEPPVAQPEYTLTKDDAFRVWAYRRKGETIDASQILVDAAADAKAAREEVAELRKELAAMSDTLAQIQGYVSGV